MSGIARKLMGVTKGAAPEAFYTTDFGNDTLNSLPSGWGYVSGNSQSYQRVVADAATISGKKLEANFAQFLYLIDSPTDADVDILSVIRYDFSGTSNPTGPFCRKSGSITSGISVALNNTYYTGKRSTLSSISLEHRASSAVTVIDSEATTLTNADWVSVRLKVQGSNLQSKVWLFGDPEPDWQLSGTNSALTSSGLLGLRSNYNNSAAKLECQYFSVGIGGNLPDLI